MSALWRAQANRLQSLAVEVCWRPADDQTGADFHDVVDIHNGRVAVVLGQAGGSLPERSRLAQEVLFELRRGFLVTSSALEAFDRLDRVVASSGDAPASRAMCAVFDPTTAELEIVNAGLPAPLLSSGIATSFLDDCQGAPLGYSTERHSSHHKLRDSTTLFMFTEGLLAREDIDHAVATETLRRSAEILGNAATWASELARRVTEHLGQPRQDASLVSVRPARRLDMSDDEEPVSRRAALRVYLDPDDARSARARSVVQELAAGLRGTMEVEVEMMDINASSRQAEVDGVIAAPSVLRVIPTPMVQVVGGVRSVEELARALELPLPAKERD